MYLFLSEGSRYIREDIEKTVEAAWQRRFHKKAPDLGDSESNYGLGDVVLTRSAAGLELKTTLIYDPMNGNGATKRVYRFVIDQANFKQ